MRFGIVAVLFLLAACAAPGPKTLYPIGGSRADGTVELAFEYGLFEQPQVNDAQALTTARARYQAWGYADAEAFGSFKKQCVQVNGYGSCLQNRVTVPYQCTGSPDQKPAASAAPSAPDRKAKAFKEMKESLARTSR